MRPSVRGGAPLGGGQLLGAQQTETWNIFIASDSPAIKVPGARASRYRVYGVIGLHIGNYPKISLGGERPIDGLREIHFILFLGFRSTDVAGLHVIHF